MTKRGVLYEEILELCYFLTNKIHLGNLLGQSTPGIENSKLENTLRSYVLHFPMNWLSFFSKSRNDAKNSFPRYIGYWFNQTHVHTVGTTVGSKTSMTKLKFKCRKQHFLDNQRQEVVVKLTRNL